MRDPIVVDASALLHLLLGDDVGDRVAQALGSRLVVAPPHLDAEVLSALHRLRRQGNLSDDDLEQAVANLATVPVLRWEALDLLEAAHGLRDEVGSHDSWYVALGRRLTAPLVTLDRRLARARPGETIVP